MNDPNNEQRRSARKRANVKALVVDTINGTPMGHLGNFSRTGMLVISTQVPRSEALYQVNVLLPTDEHALQPVAPINVGIQEQWHATAASPGQVWAGYRIIAISDADTARLDAWLAQA